MELTIASAIVTTALEASAPPRTNCTGLSPRQRSKSGPRKHSGPARCPLRA